MVGEIKLVISTEKQAEDEVLSSTTISNAREAIANPAVMKRLQAEAAGTVTAETVCYGIATTVVTFPLLFFLFYCLVGGTEWLLPALSSLSVGAFTVVTLGPSHARQTLAAVERLLARKAEREREEAEKSAFIGSHLSTLARKYESGHKLDDYGNVVDCGWAKELRYFWEKVMQPRFPYMPAREAEVRLASAMNVPWLTIAGCERLDAVGIRSGSDFEFLVKQTLEATGWVVRHNGRSGDQGADLIANRSDVMVVVQCKYFSAPVGNSAVQEAYSAQRYCGANYAAVVSNATFTQSARQLADACDVILLHPTELSKLEKFVGYRKAM